MFSDLDAAKLTTKDVRAHVFFYRGADAYRMMDNLKRDTKCQNLSKQQTVSKVFLLTGSNNVDQIRNRRQTL